MSDDMMPGVFTLGEALAGALLHLLRSRFLDWRPAEIALKGPAGKANCGAKEKAITEESGSLARGL